MKHSTYNTVVDPIAENYKYGYQGQELQDELGLNWSSFKWRNADPALGRFMSVDPLAEDYVYNSTYAFQENKLGMGRELEGLELLTWDDLIAAGEYIEDVAVGVAETTGETIGFYGEKSMSAVYNFSQGRFDEALDDISQLYTSPVGEMQLVTAENNESVDLSDGKSVGKAIAPIVTSKLTKGKGNKNTGRSGKQARLKEISKDPKTSSADRGWIKQETNSISRGSKRKGRDGILRPQKNIRNPPGKDLAHPYKKRAKDGHSYENAKLKNKADHKTEHKIHGYK